MSKTTSKEAVPDDVVSGLASGTVVDLSVFSDDIWKVSIRFLDGLPYKVGERAEVEVVSIERRVFER